MVNDKNISEYMKNPTIYVSRIILDTCYEYWVFHLNVPPRSFINNEGASRHNHYFQYI